MNWIALYLMLYYHRQHAELRYKPTLASESSEAASGPARGNPQSFRVYNTYTSTGEVLVWRDVKWERAAFALGEMK